MLCIAGKNNIAVDVLEYILEKRKETLCVCINSSDKGVDSWQKSLWHCANKHKIPVLKVEDLYNIEDLVFLSLEFDKLILPEKFKSNNLYNIHFSLLPKYRGMYTSAWPILNNEQYSGVTLHKIDRGIDTGDIIDQIAFKINIDDTARSLYLKYIKYGTQLVISNLDNLLENKIVAYPQDKYQASYYDKKSIRYDDIKIVFNQPAINVYNQVRAFSFKEYQLPKFNNYNILHCEITNTKSTFKPGTVLKENNNEVFVATMDYDIKLVLELDSRG